MTIISPFQQKINSIARGWDAVLSSKEMMALENFDCCADFRSIANPGQIGTKDEWLVWIKEGYQGLHPAILAKNIESEMFVAA